MRASCFLPYSGLAVSLNLNFIPLDPITLALLKMLISKQPSASEKPTINQGLKLKLESKTGPVNFGSTLILFISIKNLAGLSISISFFPYRGRGKVKLFNKIILFFIVLI